MAITITTLTENTSDHDFLAERGLSILIEMEGSKILFDTGLSNTAVHNAHALEIDLSSVDKIVLSHGHVDHTGGLRDVLKETGKVEIIAHPDIWASKYSLHRGSKRFIGLPFQREALEALGASFNLTKEPVWIAEDIVTTGDFDPAVRNHRLLVVDCWAEWCAPCRIVAPVVEQLARDYQGKITFGKLNVDKNRSLALRYGIMSIPTLLVFKDGELVDQVVGAMPRGALESQLVRHI